LVSNKVDPDPCVTAAEQYQCGLSKDVNFTTELILQRQGSIQVSELYFLKMGAKLGSTFVGYLMTK